MIFLLGNGDVEESVGCFIHQATDWKGHVAGDEEHREQVHVLKADHSKTFQKPALEGWYWLSDRSPVLPGGAAVLQQGTRRSDVATTSSWPSRPP